MNTQNLPIVMNYILFNLVNLFKVIKYHVLPKCDEGD